jgi:hypothetical protein
VRRLVLGLFSVLLSAPAIAGTFDWGTLPQELDRTPIGATTSDGKAVFMELRRARARPEEVLTYCLERFGRAGLYVPKLNRQLQGPGPSLTALDVDARTTYSVTVMPKPDGTVEVILGRVNHASRVDEGDWPPAPPAATAPVRSSTEGARALTFRAPLSSEALGAWYDRTLRERGFTRRDSTTWERGAERVLLHVERSGELSVATVWAEGSRALAPAGQDDAPAGHDTGGPR